MAISKVVYGGNTLIDLTNDTVTASTLRSGYTAHTATGTFVTGTMFQNYPSEYVFLDSIESSGNESITDSSGVIVESQTIYRKA